MIPETRTEASVPASSSNEVLPDDPGTTFETLFRKHNDLVRRAVRSVLRGLGAESDPDRIADLEQDVWCRLLERHRRRRPGPRNRGEGETIRYLRKVVRSAVVDALRAATAAKRRPAGWVAIDGFRGPGYRLEDPRNDPERRLLARDELRRHLDLWSDQLGKRDVPIRLRIVRLAWICGFSSCEIARRIGRGWTPAGIDSLLCRVRRRLDELGESIPVRGLG